MYSLKKEEAKCYSLLKTGKTSTISHGFLPSEGLTIFVDLTDNLQNLTPEVYINLRQFKNTQALLCIEVISGNLNDLNINASNAHDGVTVDLSRTPNNILLNLKNTNDINLTFPNHSNKGRSGELKVSFK